MRPLSLMRFLPHAFIVATVSFVAFAITTHLPLEWGPRDFLKTEPVWAWAQVWIAFLAIAGTGLYGIYHQDLQRRVDSADRITSAYLVARDAADLIIKASRLQTGLWTAATATDDAAELARFPQTWAAWGPERHDAYVEALAQTINAGGASGAFLEGLITIRGRLKWVKNHAGRSIGTGAMTPSDQDMLVRAADGAIAALIDMKPIATAVRREANLGQIPAKGMPEHRVPPSLTAGAIERFKQVPLL